MAIGTSIVSVIPMIRGRGGMHFSKGRFCWTGHNFLYVILKERSRVGKVGGHRAGRRSSTRPGCIRSMR
jgi:hypothetical protein